MNEIDLVGMANAILRQRDLVNSLMQENARLKSENEEMKDVLTKACSKIEALENHLLELQERQE